MPYLLVCLYFQACLQPLMMYVYDGDRDGDDYEKLLQFMKMFL